MLDRNIETIILKRVTRGKLPSRYISDHELSPVAESWVCSVCQRSLSSKQCLRKHVLTRHIRQRVHQCCLCSQSFVLKCQLSEHIRCEHVTPPALCHCICGRTFSKRNSFLSHMRRIHHPAPLCRPECGQCGKMFNDSATLRCHVVRVHGTRSFPCPEPNCEKIFATVGLRNAHHRYHEGRRYCCSVCEKPFTTSAYRDKHELTHSGIRQYGCDECGVRCITASQLGTHKKRRHGLMSDAVLAARVA